VPFVLYFVGLHGLFHCLCLRSGNQLSVSLWGKTATDFDGAALKELGKTDPVIIIFVGTLVKTYDGVFVLITVPAYIVCFLFYFFLLCSSVCCVLILLCMSQVDGVLVEVLHVVGTLMRIFLMC
jgi:hypothetical protein